MFKEVHSYMKWAHSESTKIKSLRAGGTQLTLVKCCDIPNASNLIAVLIFKLWPVLQSELSPDFAAAGGSS